jgi:hypothetical protein
LLNSCTREADAVASDAGAVTLPESVHALIRRTAQVLATRVRLAKRERFMCELQRDEDVLHGEHSARNAARHGPFRLEGGTAERGQEILYVGGTPSARCLASGQECRTFGGGEVIVTS